MKMIKTKKRLWYAFSSKKIISTCTLSLSFFYCAMGQLTQQGGELGGGVTGTNNDIYVINSDESHADAAVRLQTKWGTKFTDWMMFADREHQTLNFGNWISNSHSNANENDYANVLMSLDKFGSLEVGSENFEVLKLKRHGIHGAGLRIENGTGAANYTIGTGSDNRFNILLTDGAWNSGFVMDQSNYVGIGGLPSTVQNTKLQVHGNINATGNLEFGHSLYLNGREILNEEDVNGGTDWALQINKHSTYANIILNGNVGIGTGLFPDEKLEVNGNIKATSFIGDGSQLTGLSISNVSGNITVQDGTITSQTSSTASSLPMKIMAPSINGITGKYVGLGLGSWANSTKGALLWEPKDTWGRGELVFVINDEHDAGNADLNDEVMRLTRTNSGGNLFTDFITSTDVSSTNVSSTNVFSTLVRGDILMSNTEDDNGFFLDRDNFMFTAPSGNATMQLIKEHNAIHFSSINMPMVINNNTQNVGIGVDDPTLGKLQLAGSFHIQDSQGIQAFHVSAGSKKVFIGPNSFTSFTNASDDSPIKEKDFSLWAENGIVTEDLVIVEMDEWSDYVFDEHYDLADLETVENYILENKHLPNIPSEEEVRQNGYTLNTIAVKYLEKIEELTLYTIQQEKTIKSLQLKYENAVSELLKRVEALEK